MIEVKIVGGAPHYHFGWMKIKIMFHSVLDSTTAFSFWAVSSDNRSSPSSTVSNCFTQHLPAWATTTELCGQPPEFFICITQVVLEALLHTWQSHSLASDCQVFNFFNFHLNRPLALSVHMHAQWKQFFQWWSKLYLFWKKLKHLCMYDTTRKCLKSNCCHVEGTIALNLFIVYSDDPN